MSDMTMEPTERQPDDRSNATQAHVTDSEQSCTGTASAPSSTPLTSATAAQDFANPSDTLSTLVDGAASPKSTSSSTDRTKPLETAPDHDAKPTGVPAPPTIETSAASPATAQLSSPSSTDTTSSSRLQLPEPSRPVGSESHSAPGVVPTLATMSLADPPLSSPVARPSLPQTTQSSFSATNPDMLAKMQAFHRSRQGSAGLGAGRPMGSPNPSPGLSLGRLPGGMNAPGIRSPLQLPGSARFPGGLPVPRGSIGGPMASPLPQSGSRPGLSLKDRRNRPGGLPGGLPGSLPAGQSPLGGTASAAQGESAFNKFSNYVDTKTGTLKFAGKATIHGSGIDFSSGSSFNISLDEVDNLDELGKGNYGTVYKVRHSRPKMRRPGMGLRGNKGPTNQHQSQESDAVVDCQNTGVGAIAGGLTGIVMAMKEIRLELDEAKLTAIITELDILHRCTSPFIIDFYGAFFQEGAVYMCMEFMDGGSVDKLYGDGVPEGVLRKITLSTVMGLKSLKEEHNIIHRDVKPTNILVNSKGQVKLCDFGVSGNLVASIAKTNIGCQSYMAPERISGGGVAQAGSAGGTYSVQSDIWSLGLSILECAMGRYPYPPETYNNIFGQLQAIVNGEAPELPKEGFSDASHKFVAACLLKNPKMRPTYATLLRHSWLAPLLKIPTISEDDEQPSQAVSKAPYDTSDEEVASWVRGAIEKKKVGILNTGPKPALHAAALDSVSAAQAQAPATGAAVS